MSSSPARLQVRRRLFPVIESVWAAAFGMFGAMTRAERQVHWWTPAGGEKVVIVATHPDDEVLGSGGVAALHTRLGDPVLVVIVTDGSSSRAWDMAPAAMARHRTAELARAAEALTIHNVVRLGLPEWSWESAQARARLAPLLADAEIVYAPSCVDYHPEHVRVAQLVADLINPDRTVRVCELGVPLTPLLVNLVADINQVAPLKERALEMFETQAAALAPLRRLARYRARFYGRQAVEVFWELPAQAYAQVVVAGDWRRGVCPFRGVRPRPLSDPLSLLFGLSARARLRRLAER